MYAEKSVIVTTPLPIHLGMHFKFYMSFFTGKQISIKNALPLPRHISSSTAKLY